MKTLNFKLSTLFWLLTGCLLLQAQDSIKIDSLISQLNKNPHDTIKVDTYLALHRSLLVSDESNAIEHLNKAIKFSEHIGDPKRISQCYLELVGFHRRKGNFTEAKKKLPKVEEQLNRFLDTRIEATFFKLRGTIHYFEGTYNKAIADIWEAIPLYELLGDTKTAGDCYLLIGVSYKELDNLDKALEYYQKGLDMYKKTGYRKGVAMATGNIGTVFKSKKNYDKALEYYNQSLQINEKYGYLEEAGIDLNNIGTLYLVKEDYKKASEFLKRSQEVSKLVGSPWAILTVKINLAQAAYKLGDYENAVQDFKEVVDTAKAYNYKEFIKDAYFELSNVHQEMGEFRTALEYRNDYEKWKDSLLNENHLNQVKELEIKYETEKKDQQITFLAQEKELQEKETQRQATLKNAFIGGAVLIALLASLLFYIFRQRLKNQKALASKNEEIKEVNFKRQLSDLEMKALQAQINPHFIFNCMNSINQMILEGNNKNASKYLTKFSKLIRLILENAEATEVSLKNEFALLEAYIQLESLRFNGDIKYQIQVDEDIDQENTYLPSMVIQPFVENAIWHGLRHKKERSKGQISISMEQDHNQLTCFIEDNGVGREKAAELQKKTVWKSKSLGLKITEERLKLLSKEIQCKAVIIVRINKGKVRKQLVREQMVPPKIHNGITVNIDETVADAKKITAKVTG